MRVSTSNFYVGNKQPRKDAAFLLQQGIDLGGIQEGHGNAKDIEAVAKTAGTHNVFWGSGKDAEKDFATLDVPVVYRKTLKVKRIWTRLISHRAQVKNIGMPRAATAIRFFHNNQSYTFINTHTNAAVQNRNTGEPLSTKINRVVEYIAGMVVLQAMITNAKRRGDHVILTGDLNYRVRRPGATIWQHSPQALFAANKMTYVNSGLDYIAYTGGLVASNFKIIPTTQTGSDHPWLVVDLNPKHPHS